MNYTLESFCKIHGDTTFVQYSNRKRCKKCQTDAVIKRRQKLKILAIEYKGGKCKRCGFSDITYPSVFDFHHTDSNKKDFGIGANGITRSQAKVKEELNKCDLYCANCHRIVHRDLKI